MSEQNLLNYNIPTDIHNSFNHNNNLTCTFDYSISTAFDQRKSAAINFNNPIPSQLSYSDNANLTFLYQQQKVLDQQHYDVSQSAIIINEASNIQSKNINQESDDPPTHIVSPEAIREALQEEKEEAMGKGKRRPFSKFTSFNALKERRLSIDSSLQSNDIEDEEEEEEEEEEDTDDDKITPNTLPEKLKRPPNAYLLFNRDMRRKLLTTSPKMSVAEISKEIGDSWKVLPNEQREYYIQKASLIKQEHLKKYPGFIYTRRSKAQLAEDKKYSKLGRKPKAEKATESSSAIDLIVIHQDNTTSKKRSRKFITGGGQRDPRGRKKKRQKHPFAPKHPMSAYLHYLASVYPQVSSNFPGSTVGPISKSISKSWHAMSPEQKLPWKQKAESDKARYAREMQAYMAAIDKTKQQSTDEEEDDEEDYDDVDPHTLESVVNMVNNHSNGNLNVS